MGAALVLWRLEAYTALPLALLFIATLGRWPGALLMGAVMAVYAAAFLYLLENEPFLDHVRGWAHRRRVGRALEWLAARVGSDGNAGKALALAPVIIILGPFWRAVALHLFRTRRPAAYLISVVGSIPHALFWTGLVLGGVWEGLAWPLIKDI